MSGDIRFCTTSDGVRIAYAAGGSGPTLIRVPGWVSHLELEEDNPNVRRIIDAFSPHFQFVRYDKRGTGLSDRAITDFSLDARIRDLEAVVADLKARKVYLLGVSEGGPIAMTYAARNPRKVAALALYGTFAHLGSSPAGDALVALVRAEWGLASDTLTSIFMPHATAEEREASHKFARESAHREDAALMLEANLTANVRPILKDIKTPTIVVHARHDRATAFEHGRELAGSIRGARLVPIDSDSHAPTEASSGQIWGSIRDFFLEHEQAPAAAPAATRKETGSVTVMFTDVEGSTALTQRLGDARAREIIRTHEQVTRDALRAHGGSEIKTMGDGFMASFSSATRGLQCAIAIQQALANHNESAADPIRVRIGLNAGEPIAENEDLFGTAVNLAARLAGRAEAGEILASNVVRELCAGGEFLFADRGHTELRGFEDPVRAYEVRWRETA